MMKPLFCRGGGEHAGMLHARSTMYLLVRRAERFIRLNIRTLMLVQRRRINKQMNYGIDQLKTDVM